MKQDFDAIVVGSGISGGWAAKELCEKGLKVALIERGPNIEHRVDYQTEFKSPWEMPYRGFGDQAKYKERYPRQRGLFFDEYNERYWVDDLKEPYQESGSQGFQWRRGYQTGGRSLTWGRHAFRRGAQDFEANLADGYGVDWPIRYQDIEPWYTYVEKFIGVSGDSTDEVVGLPNGTFQAPFPLTAPELALKERLAEHYGNRRQAIIGRVAHIREAKDGRAPCQARVVCSRGCSYGAYFSTQSSTLPAAKATGNLTVLNNMIVEAVDYDPATKRATGIRVINVEKGVKESISAKLIFLNASTLNTIAILMRSVSSEHPDGLGNSSGTLGKYIMDHAQSFTIAKVKGFEGSTYSVNRPANLIIPRFANLTEPLEGAVRGYSYQGGVFREGYPRGAKMKGVGASFKQEIKSPGDWMLALGYFIEALPVETNAASLSKTKQDSHGLAQIDVHYEWTDNERALAKNAAAEAVKMIELMGWDVVHASTEIGSPGSAVHEMGGARMGRDAKTSVLNSHNQMHDVRNVFVTDGAAMASSGTVNPSLTYMALTARAANYAVEEMKAGRL
ncbi:GMC family oxidoreductase [Pseudomaricurvus alcaniphilus]|uniref:GMC oxidoreductase n=1 Tax=Pseudomaricurvus alcaniphilus TaxID=1166482 RepID=UPI001407FEB3|nr:GMC family oxidoreductase [Pseudomaricurvus alcaniphilus]NHN36866.1 GMC family oxidoreductase [Pseudomaricurvus alcaniphilus]